MTEQDERAAFVRERNASDGTVKPSDDSGRTVGKRPGTARAAEPPTEPETQDDGGDDLVPDSDDDGS